MRRATADGGVSSLLDYRKPRQVRAELAPWLSCSACRLASTRRQVVLGRGVIPADVVFVGLGPGKHEDLIGAAFVGPSGALLNKAIDRAGGSRVPIHFCNLVACHPTDRLRGDNRDPEPDEIAACRGLLSTILALAAPRTVVSLGALTQTEVKRLRPDSIGLYHPRYLLRCGGSGSHEFRTFVRELEDVFEGGQ